MILTGSRKELEGNAALIISESVCSLLQFQESVVLGVVGGSSVAGIFEVLKKHQLDWGRVHLFMIDERFVPLTHPDSNFSLVSSVLDEYIAKENLHPFVFDAAKKDFGVGGYYAQLQQYGGLFDIILTSSGEDGHIASLFPNHDAISSPVEGFLPITDSPKPPAGRITASKELLLKAKIALLLIFGEQKRDVLIDYLDEDIHEGALPVKLIGRIEKHYVLTDQEVG